MTITELVRPAFSATVGASARADPSGVVHLGGTEFIDTGNVRALARASQFLDHRRRTLTLRSPSSAVVRLLAQLGMSGLVEQDESALGWLPPVTAAWRPAS